MMLIIRDSILSHSGKNVNKPHYELKDANLQKILTRLGIFVLTLLFSAFDHRQLLELLR